MSPAEEIKAKLDIVEVIREYIQVKATGANFQALCPFHREKTPSFVISPDKQIWHCFGCGKGGDVLSFVQEIEGLSFPDTLRLLAPKAGVVLYEKSNHEYSKRDRLLDILEKSTNFYQFILNAKNEYSQRAREYLLSRHLSDNTIAEWKIGYSLNDWDKLYTFLRNRPKSGKKFLDDEIFAAGLIIKKNNNRGYYDRFRNRIMFPISNENGKVIAFTARLLPGSDDKSGKYINCPSTDLYDKSAVLFGLDKAKKFIREENLAIIVEGQMDVITGHQNGFKNLVASSGTSLTLQQLKILKKYTNNIAFALDSDMAGSLAKERGGDLVENNKYFKKSYLDANNKIKIGLEKDDLAEINIFIIEIKNAKDVDESINKDKKSFDAYIAAKKPYFHYIFDLLFQDLDLSNSIKLKENIDIFTHKLSLSMDQVSVNYWINRLCEKTGINEEIVRDKILQFSFAGQKNNDYSAQNVKNKQESNVYNISRENRLSELLLAILLKAPDFILYCSSHLETEDLSGEKNQAFYKNLIIYYNKFAVLDYDSFCLYLQEQQDYSADICARLALLGEKDYYNYDTTALKLELTKIILDLKKFSLKRKIKQLQDQLATAEAGGEEENLNLLLTEIKNLSDELNSLQSL